VVALVLLVCSFLAGAALQRRRHGAGVRDGLWRLQFHVVGPALILVTFTTLEVDRGFAQALVAVVLATWLVAGAAYAYAALVARARDERGALALAGAFGNTGFVGMPLAQLAFGSPGLALAVVYDRLAWLVPATGVSTAVARLHGRRQPGDRHLLLRTVLTNTPLAAMLAALAVRAEGLELPFAGATHDLAAVVIGPLGFLLLGLSLPLEPPVHPPAELRRIAGALAIRMAGGPLALLAIGSVLAAEVPAVFYLLAGMPSAFHLITLARVYDVRPALVRLAVVSSTAAAVVSVATARMLV
jgi:predicted permease